MRDVRETMNRDRDRRLLLERQLDEAQSAAPGDVLSAPTPGDRTLNAAASGTAQQLAAAQVQLAGFEQRGLKPGHPDLEAGRRRVRDLQARLSSEMASSTSTSTASGPAVSPAEAVRLRRIADIGTQIAEIDRQIARNQEEEGRLQVVALESQRRVDAIPTRESELVELNRDYATLNQAYNELLRNKQESQIAANLENRQVGEQFRLLDPAQRPERPSSPNRPRDIGLGLLAGLALGLGLVGLLEYRDTTFKTDQDVAAVLDLPVLAVVPVMKSDEDVRRALWARVFVSTGLGSVVAACLTFVAYVLVS